MNLISSMNNFYYQMSMYELQVCSGGSLFDGVSYNSLLYINIIDKLQPCLASKIADALNITRSAVTIKLNELEKKGMIVKEQSKTDKRAHIVRISEHMKDMLNVYDDVFAKIEKRLKCVYSNEQLEQFNKILTTISSYNWGEIQNE